MSRQIPVVAVALMAFVLAGPRGGAQENAPAPGAAGAQATNATDAAKAQTAVGKAAPRPDRPTTNLRVQVIVNRFQGEKKTGSLPYAFNVTAGGDHVRMRMGVDTPVPVFTGQQTGTGNVIPTSYQYRNVGTNIDCRAQDLGDSRYKLNLTVENSSTLPGSEKETDVSKARAPLFRRFETSLDPILRDGQTIQTVASTDPVTGEVVKIDVTLNVVR
jgi:hypothetical protein